MKVNKKIVIPVIILLVIVAVVVIFYMRTRDNGDKQIVTDNQTEAQNNETKQEENLSEQNEVERSNSEEENERINKVKEQYGFTGDNSLYTESNNELSIKPSIAYRTALIGSLEQRKPTYEEINIINVNFMRHISMKYSICQQFRF